MSHRWFCTAWWSADACVMRRYILCYRISVCRYRGNIARLLTSSYSQLGMFETEMISVRGWNQGCGYAERHPRRSVLVRNRSRHSSSSTRQKRATLSDLTEIKIFDTQKKRFQTKIAEKMTRNLVCIRPRKHGKIKSETRFLVRIEMSRTKFKTLREGRKAGCLSHVSREVRVLAWLLAVGGVM